MIGGSGGVEKARHTYFKDYYCVAPSDCGAAYGEDLHAMALKNIDLLNVPRASMPRRRRYLLRSVAPSSHILWGLGASR